MFVLIFEIRVSDCLQLLNVISFIYTQAIEFKRTFANVL